jgi:hypothetical protein
MVEDTTVQRYDKDKRGVAKTQDSKALKFVDFKCIHQVTDNVYICLPLNTKKDYIEGGVVYKKRKYPEDYNFTTYKIIRINDRWECDCQGFTSKQKRKDIIPSCSHILALEYYFKRDATTMVLKFLRQKKVFVTKTTIANNTGLSSSKVNQVLRALRRKKIVSMVYNKKYWGLRE